MCTVQLGSGDRKGKYPERARQFYRRGDRERLRAVDRGRADDAAGIVYGKRRPEAELLLRKPQ
ncbi:hypothetical protein SDC9_211175 [bioreactor metagenome]|uniref:Uncharacterized protein n=1 Tax=bioreactor metagenome TaxID=1076179 RepID=A0A645JJ06_9ZZZZ